MRRLYYCPDCKGYFSETYNTPLASLKTPLSRIVEILQALNEGLGVNAVCRVFGVSKNSLYRWQERLSDLKPTLLLYALCHQFLNLVIEGIRRFPDIEGNPQRMYEYGRTGRLLRGTHLSNATEPRALLHCQRQLQQTLERALNYLSHNAERAHPNRDQRSGRSKLGLEHVYGCP